MLAMESQAVPAPAAGNSTSTGQQLLLESMSPNDWLFSPSDTRKDGIMGQDNLVVFLEKTIKKRDCFL